MIRILSFLAFFQCSIFIQAQIPIDSLGNIPFSDRMSDVWGFEKDGSEYAVATTKEGVAFIDVTEPTAPELLFYPQGPSTIWRDAKVWGDYVYVSNEKSGGIRIFDLANFPDTITYTNWVGGDFEGSFKLMNDAHNVFIDENGILYVIGHRPDIVGGVMMLDIASNPTNPDIVGIYDANYVHDIFVRGDTMWTAEVYDGQFAVVDISDKLNWTVLATQTTPANFTHNVWLSDNGQYLFTTDETVGGGVASYDVSDLTDIQLLDVYSPSGTTAIPHNTYVLGNYLVTSYYTVGVKVLDFTDPYNLTEVNGYDTSPYIGQTFNGCWGVYPYLPSGNIIATDVQEGFFVLGEPPFTSSLSLTVKLGGAIQSDGTMRTDLQSQGYLPSVHAYNQAPYNFGMPTPASSIPTNTVDWILVEARSGTPNTSGSKGTTTVETHIGVLLNNGQIVGEDGNPLVFKELIEGNDYYFCVRHRNHLDVLTANSITAANIMSYDFTTNVSQAFGVQQQQLFTNGEAVLYAGDFNQDGTIQNTDFDAWKLTPAVLGTYAPTDANLDGVIQVTDYDAWFPNKAKIGTVEIDF